MYTGTKMTGVKYCLVLSTLFSIIRKHHGDTVPFKEYLSRLKQNTCQISVQLAEVLKFTKPFRFTSF